MKVENWFDVKSNLSNLEANFCWTQWGGQLGCQLDVNVMGLNVYPNPISDRKFNHKCLFLKIAYKQVRHFCAGLQTFPASETTSKD